MARESTQETWRRRLGADGGATALEFALVALPFIFVLIAVVELGLIFVANLNLQSAMFSISRQVRVGTIVAPGLSATSSSGNQLTLTDMKKRICAAMPLTGGQNCTSSLLLDVRELNGFGSSAPASPFTGTSMNTNSFCYYSGASGSVVEMRAYYLWPVFTPLLLNALINTKSVSSGGSSSSGNWFALSSQEVFRNEPGSTSSNSGSSC